MHKIRSAIWHKSYNIISDHLTIHSLGNVLLESALVVSLLSVDCLALTNHHLVEIVGHRLFELEKYLEEVLTQVGQVLFFEELGVDLRKTVKLRVHLIFGD